MPIPKLLEIKRLKRVGKIHLGVKDTARSGKLYPKAVDYFVVKTEETTPQSAVNAFKSIYGNAPKELKIMFPVNTVNVFWDQWYKSYVRAADNSGKLICKGDGISADRLNMKTGSFEEIQCPGPEECPFAVDDKGKPKCRRVGSLQFLLPEVGILGVWQIDTSSFNGIVSLNSDIDMIRAVTGGFIAMIPLYLKLIPRKVNIEGKQNTIFHLTVEFRGTIKDLIEASKLLNHRQLEVPQINHNETPEDLFPPKRQLERKPAPAKNELSKKAVELAMHKGLSIEDAQAMRDKHESEESFMKYLSQMSDSPKDIFSEGQPAADDIDAQIEAFFDERGFPQKQREAIRSINPDKKKLLSMLKNKGSES